VECEFIKTKPDCCILHTQQWKVYWTVCGPRVWHSWCRGILQWWRDHRVEFLSHLAGSTFCVMATSAANEPMFIIDDRVVKSRRAI